MEKDNDNEILKTYNQVVQEITEKGYVFFAEVAANSFITRKFEYWIANDNKIENENLVLIELLRNGDAIVYLETDIKDLN
jgi:hypothetical protein